MNKPTLEETQLWLKNVLIYRGTLHEKLVKIRNQTEFSIDDFIKNSNNILPAQRLGIYSSGYTMRLVECMKASFPILIDFMGEQFFDTFAEAYIVTIPSSSWNLFELGAKFPEFLEDTKPDASKMNINPDIIEIPIEIAKYERAKSESLQHKGFEKKEQIHNPMFSLFGIDFENTNFQVPECLQLISLKFQIHTLIPNSKIPPVKKKTLLAISRRDYRLKILEVEAWQFELLGALKSGSSLPKSIQQTSFKTNISETKIKENLLTWITVAKNNGCLYNK